MKLDSVMVEETSPGSGLWLWYARSPGGILIAHGAKYVNWRGPVNAATSIFDLVTRGIPLYVRGRK